MSHHFISIGNSYSLDLDEEYDEDYISRNKTDWPDYFDYDSLTTTNSPILTTLYSESTTTTYAETTTEKLSTTTSETTTTTVKPDTTTKFFEGSGSGKDFFSTF